MNGKIFQLSNGKHIIGVNNSFYHIRPEDGGLPFVLGSDVEFTLDDSKKAIINKCETIAEIHNLNMGWICPRCNKVNAPFKELCDC
jgi:hypothetical protein